jgi:hypothetical protein
LLWVLQQVLYGDPLGHRLQHQLPWGREDEGDLRSLLLLLLVVVVVAASAASVFELQLLLLLLVVVLLK